MIDNYCQVYINIVTMPFSAQSIEQIRQSAAASSQKNNSPRGVADATATTFFADAATANSTCNNDSKDGACEIKQGAPPQQLSDAAINHFTTQFITEIISNAITMMEYCGRLTLCPGDVAKSLDLFARQQAIDGDDGACDSDIMSSDVADIMDEDEDDEARIEVSSSKVVGVSDIEKVCSGIIKLQAQVRGVNVRTEKNDHVLTDYDSDSSEDFDDDMEEVPYINDMKYNLQNTDTPTFDEVYPTVDSMAVLSDEEYKNQVFMPTFDEGEDGSSFVIGRSLISIGDGTSHNEEDDEDDGREMIVMGMMKRATYAYLVKRMS